MTSEHLHLYRIAFAICGIALLVVQPLAHFALRRLRTAAPETLARAGIREIDWWPRCIRGSLLLGYGEAGRSLPTQTRWLFRSYGVAIGALLALAAMWPLFALV